MTDIFQVDIIGVKTPEEKESIRDKVTTALRGPLRILKNPQRLQVRYKKHEKEGIRHLYELEFKLESEYGMNTIKVEKWDLLDAIDEGLNKLEAIVRKEKSKIED